MTVKRVSPKEADALVRDQGYVYVDVRSIPEFDSGHPTGAYNVPLMHQTGAGMQPNADFVPVMLAAFPKDAKLVVGCRSGGRSLRAATMLLEAGFENVVDQRGGMAGARNAFGQLEEEGWEAAGLPLSQEPDPERTYSSLEARKSG